jgi:RNA polymerase sigma-70 factor, ECF subfamily
MSEVDDARLLEQARRGNGTAFSELFGRYQRAVYRYAAYMCGLEFADDIVQETFLAVLRQSNRSNPPQGPVIGYLLGIARHLVWKRFRSQDEESSLESEGDGIGEVPADQTTPLDDLTRRETIDAVRAAVRSLPLNYREAIVLCEFHELEYAAAAAVIQCPVGTVRSRLNRAKALLMAKLRDVQSPHLQGR